MRMLHVASRRIRVRRKGRMVPEFEKVSYELGKGEISSPFETRYGVHIVKKLDSHSVADYASVRDQLTAMVGMRGNIAVDSKVAQLKKKYKFSLNDKLMKRLRSEVTLPDSLDNAFIDKYVKRGAVHSWRTEISVVVADW